MLYAVGHLLLRPIAAACCADIETSKSGVRSSHSTWRRLWCRLSDRNRTSVAHVMCRHLDPPWLTPSKADSTTGSTHERISSSDTIRGIEPPSQADARTSLGTQSNGMTSFSDGPFWGSQISPTYPDLSRNEIQEDSPDSIKQGSSTMQPSI